MAKSKRNSSIELLKIFAIFIIVIGHVTLSLGNYVSYSRASTDVTKLILALFHLLGGFGNTIFFICSAWFLLDSNKLNKRKWFNMLSEIWVISVIILFISLFILKYQLPKDVIFKSLFPTTFENNWYMTCYLIFYLIHPILNNIINSMSQRKLLRCTICLTMLYIVFNFIMLNTFYFSMITLWITIYFIIAYMKKYLKDISKNNKINFAFVYVGLILYISVVIICDILGLINPSLSGNVLYSANNCNPFIILMSIGLFNIAKNKKFTNYVINYISSLSMPIYIIHENIILRNYTRLKIWGEILSKYGRTGLISKTLALSILIFVFSIFASSIYKIFLEGIIIKVSNALYDALSKIYKRFENVLLKI